MQQLGTDENTEAQENDEDAMDVDEEEQVVEGDEAASDGDETSSTSATSDASDEEDLQPDVAIDSQLRKKVAEALRASGMADSDSEDEDEVMQEAEKDAAPGTSKTLKEGADEDAGSDSGSDVSNMDDDQMLKLDDQLAQIFKLQSNKKGGDGEFNLPPFHLSASAPTLIDVSLSLFLPVCRRQAQLSYLSEQSSGSGRSLCQKSFRFFKSSASSSHSTSLHSSRNSS